MVSVKRVLFVIFAGAFLLIPAHSDAAKKVQPQNTVGGISISPFIQQIDILPGDIAKSFTLTLTNHTSTLQELNLTPRDFGTLNDSGGILLEGNNKYTQKYGLTSWMSLGADTVALQPKESRDVLVTINNRTSLQPGGHYAAVVASVKTLDESTAGNKVAINQQLLSLILVNKMGGEHYALKLTSIQENGNWLHLPNTVKLRFQNPGNVHVIPRGTVKLTSPSGKVLAKGVINSESAYVLPESFREIYVPLTTVSKDIPFPGVYHVEVDYRYDGIDQTAHKFSIVKFINLKIYIFGLIILLVIWRVILNYKSYPKKQK